MSARRRAHAAPCVPARPGVPPVPAAPPPRVPSPAAAYWHGSPRPRWDAQLRGSGCTLKAELRKALAGRGSSPAAPLPPSAPRPSGLPLRAALAPAVRASDQMRGFSAGAYGGGGPGRAEGAKSAVGALAQGKARKGPGRLQSLRGASGSAAPRLGASCRELARPFSGFPASSSSSSSRSSRSLNRSSLSSLQLFCSARTHSGAEGAAGR